MINRKIFFTFAASITISGFVVICTLGQSLHRQKVQAKSERIVQELEQIDFVVREYNGKLGVFRGESKSPYKIIDFNVTLMSDYDRELLKEGITLKTEQELDTFIEDIIS